MHELFVIKENMAFVVEIINFSLEQVNSAFESCQMISIESN